MRRALLLIAPLGMAWAVFAQSPPPASSPVAPPLTAAAPLPKNIDRMLADPITVNATHLPLAEFADLLRTLTETNIVLNWNALAQSGITRETPVDLHLKDVPYEQVVKTLMEIVPPAKGKGGAAGTGLGRLNYTVGDNILTITTNAALGAGNVPVILDVTRAVSYTFEKTATKAQQDAHGVLLEKVFRAELARAGEPMDAKGHALAVRNGTLAGTLSARGKGVLERAISQLNTPVKVGQLPPGTQMTALAKKTDALLKAARAQGMSNAELARRAAEHPHGLNVALLPGTAEELAKPGGVLESTISDGGVVLIGPHDALLNRPVMAVYDLRELIRRMIAKTAPKAAAAPPDEVQAAIVQSLKIQPPFGAAGQNVPPESWGQLGQASYCMVPYNGLLIVFAPAETQRALVMALQGLNK